MWQIDRRPAEAAWEPLSRVLAEGWGGHSGGGMRPVLFETLNLTLVTRENKHKHTQFNPAGLKQHWFICLFKADLYLLIHPPLLWKERGRPQTSGVARKRPSEAAFIRLDCIKPRPPARPSSPAQIMSSGCRCCSAFLQLCFEQLLHLDDIQ